MNLLIVDDHPTNLKLLRAQLEAEGHAVFEANDGVDALAVLERQRVDAVISDILMPRMDGYRLCHEIRKHARLRDLPIIIHTATYLSPGDEKLVEESKKNGRPGPEVELTYNWDSEDYGEARYFGHLAYEVDDIYATCETLMKAGVTINRPPRDGVMAFVRSPDKHSIELLQKGAAKSPQEPWKSMPNTGKW
jgi:lactoylglutathione lyase